MYKNGKITLKSRLLVALMAFMLIVPIFRDVRFDFSAKADTGSSAIYLGEDRKTKGAWYVKDSEIPRDKDDPEPENPDNITRIYGRDGVMIPYHKVTGDGQPVKNVDMISDLSEESPVNYVEYPEYVTEMIGDIRSTNDTPHGYWNYSENNSNGSGVANGSPSNAALRSVDPAQWNTKDVMQITKDTIDYTVKVDDGDTSYHMVSAYVAHNEKPEMQKQQVRILDLDGNVLSSVLVTDTTGGVYVSFAFKGSIIVQAKSVSGGALTHMAGVFFDPLVTDGAYDKSEPTYEVEEAKIVNLSWTNGAQASKTTVYRKRTIEPDSAFVLVGTTNNAADTAFSDTSAAVSKKYEYRLGSRVETGEWYVKDVTNSTNANRTLTTISYSYPSVKLNAETAPYTLTYIEFTEAKYEPNEYGGVNATVTVYEGTKRDDNDNVIDKGKPYPNREVTFELDGDWVYDDSQGEKVANFDPVLTSYGDTDGPTVTTDVNGQATISFTPQYGGDFELVASIELMPNPNNIWEGHDEAEGRAQLSVEIPGYEDKPYLTHVSDAIRPGQNFMIYGTGLSIDGQKVAIAPAGEGTRAFSESIDGLTYLTPVLDDPLYAKCVTLTMPEDFTAGVYEVWVKNDKGWSNGVQMNAARTLFLNQEAAYEGQQIEVVGRNFFPTEFGMAEAARDNLRIRLERRADDKNPSTVAYDITPKYGVRYTAEQSATGVAVDESNPYRLTFVVPQAETGVYDVLVTNDGKNYGKLYNGQTLEIVAKKAQSWNEEAFGAIADSDSVGNDPLGLGVYWAQDFNWDKVSFVDAELGADQADDTAALQEGIDKLSGNGGGVLYLPAGSYYASALVMKPNVVIVGESRDSVSLYANMRECTCGLPVNYFVRSTSDYTGLARLTVKLADKAHVPDIYFNFTDQDSTESDVELRQLKSIFFKDMKLDFPMVQHTYGDTYGEKKCDSRGLGFIIVGEKNFLLEDLDVTGFFAVLHRGFVNKYVSVRNSTFNVYRDVMHVMASFAFIENTKLLGGHEEGHGWSARSECYFGNNYIEKVGVVAPKQANSGEIIMLEVPGAQINYGKVLGVSADGRRITLDREKGSPMTYRDYNDFAIVITDGKGAGQQRYISKTPVANEDGEILGNTFKLREGERDWDIMPDQTSLYAIYVPINSPTIYRNSAFECAKSIYFFSQVTDGLIAENTLKDTEGIAIYSTLTGGGAKGTNFFNRVQGNSVDGISPMTHKGGIGITTGRFNEGTVYKGTLNGVTVIRDNTVTNTRGGEIIDQSEISSTRGIYVWTRGAANVVDDAGDAAYTIIENNTVENSEYGVFADNRVYSLLIDGNTFKNIEAEEYVTIVGTSAYRIYADLTFDLQGGTMDDAPSAGKYALNTYLDDPTKAGMTFWGWSYDKIPAADAQPFLGTGASNGTMYAVWGHRVTLDYGYSGQKSELFWFEGSTDWTVEEPTRADYKFDGWYTDEGLTVKYDGSAPTENMTLYAKWTSTAEPDGKKGCGCGGALDMASAGFAAAVLLLTAAVGAAAFYRKRRD